ncbi:hypothetical protein HaLaN_20585 [Haematococcus lacustris]|uniref:Uncharacterized protein n=1 Tax=Haematococcus lacustris TaxID=44745 RepID=A0A699ZJU1_HAELA|nr:hypothetical protein HaLaN_20585 [Haematococcus lacustris]
MHPLSGVGQSCPVLGLGLTTAVRWRDWPFERLAPAGQGQHSRIMGMADEPCKKPTSLRQTALRQPCEGALWWCPCEVPFGGARVSDTQWRSTAGNRGSGPVPRGKSHVHKPPQAPRSSQAQGNAAEAKLAPQPGRWLDRDCNAALNMQRIGLSRWRPLELCYWPEQGKLPVKGKEYPGLGYKPRQNRPSQAQQPPAEAQ